MNGQYVTMVISLGVGLYVCIAYLEAVLTPDVGFGGKGGGGASILVLFKESRPLECCGCGFRGLVCDDFTLAPDFLGFECN